MKNYSSTLAFFLFLALPGFALAAVPYPPISCPPGLIGCGSNAPANVIQQNIPQLAQFMVNIAGGAAVLFIAWAGFQMMTSMGDDGKLSQQKWSIAYVLGGLSVAALAQSLVSFVGTQQYGQGSPNSLVVNLLGYGLSILLTLFNAVFAMVIIIGGIRMVYAQGKSDEFNTGRKMIVWAIFGAIITNLSNALVQALARIFGV